MAHDGFGIVKRNKRTSFLRGGGGGENSCLKEVFVSDSKLYPHVVFLDLYLHVTDYSKFRKCALIEIYYNV